MIEYKMLEEKRKKVSSLALRIIGEQGLDLRSLYNDELYRHSEDVADIAVTLGLMMEMNLYDCITLSVGGYLHDFGKNVIISDILYKKGPLDDAEYQLVQGHPSFGYRELRKPCYNFDEKVLEIVLYHHEKLNGKGYPTGNTSASLLVQIVTIADMYDAIHQPRSYHGYRTVDETMDLMKASEGLNPVILMILSEAVKNGTIS